MTQANDYATLGAVYLIWARHSSFMDEGVEGATPDASNARGTSNAGFI